MIVYTLPWDPGQAPRMLVESLRCSNQFIFSEEDLTPGPNTVSSLRALCSRNFIKEIVPGKSLTWTPEEG